MVTKVELFVMLNILYFNGISVESQGNIEKKTLLNLSNDNEDQRSSVLGYVP